MLRPTILIILVSLNLISFLALVGTVRTWVGPPGRQRMVLCGVTLVILLLNLPLALFFFRSLDSYLLRVPVRGFVYDVKTGRLREVA